MIFARKKNKVTRSLEVTDSPDLTPVQQDLGVLEDPGVDNSKRMPWEDAPNFLEVVGSHPEDFSNSGRLENRATELRIAPEVSTPEIVDAGELRPSVGEEMQSYVSGNSVLPASDAGLSVEEDLANRFGDDVKSALGVGTVIEGRFKFDSPVRVDGTLSGEVTSSSALIVGPSAIVEGEIRVGSLIVLGCVRGAVLAEDLVEVRAGGILEADVETLRVSIEDGARYEGTCRMLKEQEQKISLVAND